MKSNTSKFVTVIYVLVIVSMIILSLSGALRRKEIVAAERATAAQSQPTGGGIPLLSEVMESEALESAVPWTERTSEIVFRLLLAVLLSGLLAFRPQRHTPLFQRNFHVAQTEILLAVVAASLMMIVGNNAARAFAIFAAVSLVRFRTNIRDPKEITVLLVSLALGLSAGVGKWELGVVLCFFVLGLLWLLEQNQAENSYRPMQLTVCTKDIEKSQKSLEDLFAENNISAEIRKIIPSCEESPVGKLRYYLSLNLNSATDKLSEEIMSSDPENVLEVDWKYKRNERNIYQ